MYPGLNYKDDDEKFILLGKVFETIEKKNSKEILSRIGFKNRDFGIICIKIFLMPLFFNYPLSRVIDELNNKEELRNLLVFWKFQKKLRCQSIFLDLTLLNIIKW